MNIKEKNFMKWREFSVNPIWSEKPHGGESMILPRWISVMENWRERYTIVLERSEWKLSRFMYHMNNNNIEAFYIINDQWKFNSLELAKKASESDFNLYPDITKNPLCETRTIQKDNY